METRMNEPSKQNRFRGLGFGLVLMGLGVVLLGLNFGFIAPEMRKILISWQMLLIVIGIGNLIKGRHHIVSGIILITVGSFFIFPRIVHVYPALFPGINADFTQIYWPLLLIIAGILVITGKIFGPQWGWQKQHRHHYRHTHRRRGFEFASTDNGSQGFSKDSIFSSGEHIVLDPEFKGGEMNAVFGGITLDLRRTNLPEGDTYLEVNAVFGGITIYVPYGWNVETHLDTVFGGFQDNRLPKEIENPGKRLIIKGSCVFGGGELRN